MNNLENIYFFRFCSTTMSCKFSVFSENEYFFCDLCNVVLKNEAAYKSHHSKLHLGKNNSFYHKPLLIWTNNFVFLIHQIIKTLYLKKNKNYTLLIRTSYYGLPKNRSLIEFLRTFSYFVKINVSPFHYYEIWINNFSTFCLGV